MQFTFRYPAHVGFGWEYPPELGIYGHANARGGEEQACQSREKEKPSLFLLLGHVNPSPAVLQHGERCWSSPTPQFLKYQHLTHISLASVGSWSWASEKRSAFSQAVFSFLCRPGTTTGLALPSLPQPCIPWGVSRGPAVPAQTLGAAQELLWAQLHRHRMRSLF